MTGAALMLPLAAGATPDPHPQFPIYDRHDCNTGFVHIPDYYDNGPITDPLHHYVEPLTRPITDLIPTLPAPLAGIDFDLHNTVGCNQLVRQLGL